MAIVRGTVLYDSNGDILKDNVNEVLTCFPELSSGSYIPDFTPEEIEYAVRAHINTYIIKVFTMNYDETIRMDVTSDIDESTFNYSEEYQTGQRRSMRFDMDDLQGNYFPNPQDGIWYGTKFHLMFGLLIGNYVLYFPKGVFMVKDISYGDKRVSLQFADKFAMIDGTISGMTESHFKIPSGTPIKTAVETLLLLDSGNATLIDKSKEIVMSYPYDEKIVIFPSKYKDALTPYTINYDYQKSIGEIITELAKIISCEVYYDEIGHLVFEPSDELIDISLKPVQWRYLDNEMQFFDTSLSLDFTSVYNKVMVVGSTINGKIHKSIQKNNNPSSPTCIGNTPVRFLYIEDNNIYSDELCATRAEFELQKQTLLSMPINFASIYIPFLSVGNLVTYTNDDISYKASGNKVFDNEKIILTGINIAGDKTTTIQAKNVRELPFYG